MTVATTVHPAASAASARPRAARGAVAGMNSEILKSTRGGAWAISSTVGRNRGISRWPPHSPGIKHNFRQKFRTRGLNAGIHGRDGLVCAGKALIPAVLPRAPPPAPFQRISMTPRPGACRAVAPARTRTAHLRPRWRAPRTASVSVAILGDVQCVQGGVALPGPSLAPPGAHARPSGQLGNGGPEVSSFARVPGPGTPPGREGAARASARNLREGEEALYLSTNRQDPHKLEPAPRSSSSRPYGRARELRPLCGMYGPPKSRLLR
jgi:hypothetical protein